MGRLVRWIVIGLVILLVRAGGQQEAEARRDRDRDSSYSREGRRDRGERSLFRDYDNDGTPNGVDPYDNDWYKPDTQRDFDGDGIPNAVDPYDNEGWKP